MCELDPQQMIVLIVVIGLMLAIAVVVILGCTAEMFIERDPQEPDEEDEDDEPATDPIVDEEPPGPTPPTAVKVTTTSAI